MTEPTFVKRAEVNVEARGRTLWTLGLSYVVGPVRIQIKADPSAQWSLGSKTCGPSGSYDTEAQALLPSAPIGALIGKIGGGDADCPAPPTDQGGAGQQPAGVKVFAIGSYAVIDVKSGEAGALFLAMNDKLSAFTTHSGHLTVTVFVAVA